MSPVVARPRRPHRRDVGPRPNRRQAVAVGDVMNELLSLLDNPQMPDNATPAVTLGELRALRAALIDAHECVPNVELREALDYPPPYRGSPYEWMSAQEAHSLGWSEAMAFVRAALGKAPR